MVHADNEFGPMKPLIDKLKKGPTINLAEANEHVPEIERRIRLLKKRIISVRGSLPFKKSAIYDDHLFGTKRQKILNIFYNQRWDIKNYESQGNYVWRMARPRK